MAGIVFSGSREGMTTKQMDTLDERLWALSAGQGVVNITSFHHGVSGESDHIAHQIAKKYHYWIIGHPSSDPHHEQYRFVCTCDEIRDMRPPLDRNQDMITEVGPELGRLIATPKTDTMLARPSGTYSTVLRAINAGVQYEIIQRNGKIRFEL